MIVDAHTHIQDPTWPKEFETVDYLVSVMDRFGIDKAIAIPLDGLAGFDYREGNTRAAEACRKYPDRVYPVAHIVTTMYGIKEALKEAERCILRLGMKGLKTHTPTEMYAANDPHYSFPLVEKAIELDVPLFFHCGDPATCQFSDPILIADTAEHFPECKVWLGHLGHRRWGDAIWAAKQNPNIWLDTSFAQTSAIVRAVKTIGAERVLMGSDNPINSSGAVLGNCRAMEPYGITQEEIALVMGRNAERYLHL